ncbi:MAG TPA: serine hydrolase [Vicinamibacterales bacterium]
MRVPSRVTLLSGVVALLVASAAAQERPPDALAETLRARTAQRLQAIASEADGVVGYRIVDLTTGDHFSRLETTAFPAASTIKLAILYELLRQADAGAIDLDRTAPLDRRRAVPGGLLYELGTPSLSPRDLAVAMIVQSDNTATNVLIDRVGMDAVNRRMRELGLTDTHLRRYMIDLEAARRGDENVTTPADLVRLLVAFHERTGLSEEAGRTADRILRIYKRTPIRAGVPASVPVASKSGELEGVRADAGIVYVERRPYAFAAMSTYMGEGGAGSQVLEALARESYGYFSRLATVSRYGRQIR